MKYRLIKLKIKSIPINGIPYIGGETIQEGHIKDIPKVGYPLMIGSTITSNIVSINEDNSIIETMNSIYKLETISEN